MNLTQLWGDDNDGGNGDNGGDDDKSDDDIWGRSFMATNKMNYKQKKMIITN